MSQLKNHKKLEASVHCAHCGAFALQTWYSIFANTEGPGHVPEIRTKSEISGENPLNLLIKPIESSVKLLARLEGWDPLGFELNEVKNPVECRYETGNFRLAKCHACKCNSLWVGTTLIYPANKIEGPAPNEDLPEEIKNDFNEARTILAQSPRGAAALLRLCLQKLCIHLGLPGKHLESDIKSLVSRGVSEGLTEAMHILRLMGNAAVHPPGDIVDVGSKQTAIALCHLLNLIATRMLSEPRLVEEINELLPEAKRRSADKLGAEPRDSL